VKRSKTYGKNSRLILLRVWVTVTSTWELSRWKLARTCPALGVNLMAFESTFQTACCRRLGAPSTGPAFGSATLRRWMRLASSAARRTRRRHHRPQLHMSQPNAGEE
jgi:hypothetical protein